MKVCFVNHRVFPVLRQSFDGDIIGGSELQQVYLGSGFHGLGHDVTYITGDYGQAQSVRIDGMLVLRTYRDEQGIPGTRFIYPRLPSIWRALQQAGPDICYVRGDNYFLGAIAVYCKYHRCKLVFAGAHDKNFDASKSRIRHLRNRLMYRYGLLKADLVVCQSKQQRELLRQFHHRDGVILPNLMPGRVFGGQREQRQRYIVWVSTIREFKRPMLFLELARRLPDVNFVMIGGCAGEQLDLYERVEREARTLNNLEFLGFQPLARTEEFIDSAWVLVNTSQDEGFPNTYLQAWRSGVPTLSFFDPDGLIAANDLGEVATDISGMERALRISAHRWEGRSRRAKEYFRANHQLDNAIHLYQDKFLELLGDPQTDLSDPPDQAHL